VAAKPTASRFKFSQGVESAGVLKHCREGFTTLVFGIGSEPGLSDVEVLANFWQRS